MVDVKDTLQLDYIYTGDCLEVLQRLPDQCIDMIITSPPYFNLRDYGVDGQIGVEPSVNLYIDRLIKVFTEAHRVLKDTGSCWVNIGDSYNDNALVCAPDLFKIKMVEMGWLCRNEIIWHKPNAMPSSAKTRFNNDYEKLYFFTKKKKYFFETQYEPLKSKPTEKATGKNTGSGKYQSAEQESAVRQGMNKKRGEKLIVLRKNLPKPEVFADFLRSRVTIEDIVSNSDLKRSKVEHWFRKDLTGFSYPSIEDWVAIRWILDDWSKEFSEIDHQMTEVTIETDSILKNAHKGRIKRAVWSINTKPFRGCHYAPFPEDLVNTPILACSPEGGIVLDPFMGSGTTAVVAKKLNRHFVGIELNADYVEVANHRIKHECNAIQTEINFCDVIEEEAE